MPFTQQNIHLNSVSIHLLHYLDFDIPTFLSELTEEEKHYFFSFKHEKRKKEFLATRFLRNELFGKETILYNKIGAPYMVGQANISISHASKVSGIAVSNDFQVGFDIESISGKASRVAHKFLSDQELAEFDINNEAEMSAAWSAKETLYKLAGRKEIIFKTDLHIKKLDEDNWWGRISNPGEVLETNLKIIRQKDIIITVNTANCESK
ncbi:MAG: 4'-phosphopantetheinyl transferase superfamily protein [Bacteroidota bacterium]